MAHIHVVIRTAPCPAKAFASYTPKASALAALSPIAMNDAGVTNPWAIAPSGRAGQPKPDATSRIGPNKAMAGSFPKIQGRRG